MKTFIAKILVLALLTSSTAFVTTAYSQDKNPPKKNEQIQERKRDRKKDKSCPKKRNKKKHKHKKGNRNKKIR